LKHRGHTIDMTSGSLTRNILLFAFPLMASSLIQQLFNTADTIVVGRFAGPQALAAVGSCSFLVSLFVNFFIGFSMGTNVVISRAFGANDHDTVRRGVHTSLAFSLLCGTAMAALGFVLAPHLLRLTSVPDDIIDMATLYVRIYFLGSPASMVYNFGAAILRSNGDTKRPLYFLTAAGVLNVILNTIFVICFRMTAAGVALATIISQYLSAVLVLRCLVKEKGTLHLDLRQLTPDTGIIGQIIRIGLPSGLESSLSSIANTTIQAAVNSFGSSVIAAGSAASSIINIANIPYVSINQAVLTFSSRSLGAKQYRRTDRVILLGLLFGIGFSLLTGNLCLFFGRPLLSLYVGSNEAIILEGLIRMRIIYPFTFTASIMGTMGSALRSMGYSSLSMTFSLLGNCGLRVLWVFLLLPHFGTPASLYIVWPISWAVTAVTLAVIFLFVHKKVYCEFALHP